MKHVIALALVALVGCIPGWQQLNPEDAYQIELKQCQGDRGCESMVERKYSQYHGEGGYPAAGGGRSCRSPEDCR